MNYQHIYHAGNFADVAKHLALLQCLDALKRKNKAFFALDTHAGRGLYDLHSSLARKTGEAQNGILRLLERGRDERALAGYFAALGARAGRSIGRYPGSAALIGDALRPIDRAVFVELRPVEARAAMRSIHSAGHIRVEAADGYAALKAHLPPPERRGMVLIDPPYESIDEWKAMLRAFSDAYSRWPSGTFLIWYPILHAAQRRGAHERLESLRIPKMLSADLTIHDDAATAVAGLAGSGLVIVNPPFGIEETLRAAYEAVHRHLSPEGAGYVEIARLTPERVAQ
ncbi:MAG: 23S rRNA (adenine(2030)-N(6))-methyltransferase RlmJ [Steroidobacteraceae bacterium]|nr:23S rRNA (adenine(2030)-N(6))-methyltransferase RlmJ [Steroidobacteraceae bacterium]